MHSLINVVPRSRCNVLSHPRQSIISPNPHKSPLYVKIKSNGSHHILRGDGRCRRQGRAPQGYLAARAPEPALLQPTEPRRVRQRPGRAVAGLGRSGGCSGSRGTGRARRPLLLLLLLQADDLGLVAGAGGASGAGSVAGRRAGRHEAVLGLEEEVQVVLGDVHAADGEAQLDHGRGEALEDEPLAQVRAETVAGQLDTLPGVLGQTELGQAVGCGGTPEGLV